MSAQLALVDAPLRAVRPEELGATGLQGRRSRGRRDLRAEIRALLGQPSAKHRVTFIPVSHRFESRTRF